MTTKSVSRSGWRLISKELLAHPTALRRVLAWTAAEALPALLSGTLVAAALDRGFLAGRPLVGLAWLTGYALSIVVKTEATRRTFPWLADLVEPTRDALLRRAIPAARLRATVGDDL